MIRLRTEEVHGSVCATHLRYVHPSSFLRALCVAPVDCQSAMLDLIIWISDMRPFRRGRAAPSGSCTLLGNLDLGTQVV
jgi:hypothetical protein